MKTVILGSVGLLFSLLPSLMAGATTAPPVAPLDGQAMMNAFLRQEANRLEGQFLKGITNRAQWESHRARWHRQFLDMLGLWPLPPRTPLHAHVTGVLHRPEGYRVEKLEFQSRPHLYVTADLYLPADAHAGSHLPAVLYVCGHSPRGRDGVKVAYQHHGIWFATHGYACLMLDTLQLGEIHGVHHGTYRRNRWWWQARGYTPAGVECWNGIRGLDYLQSRPEVDPNRIAVTGRSGGGATTFWIAAADERVKVAVPVSGLSDLQDYVGEKVINGHCDCMFLINTYQWPWTRIAALIAPRPLLIENAGHDSLFPMDGNERVRARLERLYGFYTNRTDQLFDIGIVPGGHHDIPELRLMAYRWINRFLKGDNRSVTEPVLPRIDGKMLRAFPGQLPTDEINSNIDRFFVTRASKAVPHTAAAFPKWRAAKMARLRRLVFRSVPKHFPISASFHLGGRQPQTGTLPTEPGIVVPWKYFPAASTKRKRPLWLVVLDEDGSLATKPEWLTRIVGHDAVLLVAPRGSGPLRWKDPAPYYIRRALPLLGRTVDSCRLVDVLATAKQLLGAVNESATPVNIIGRGPAGVIGAYAALLEPRLAQVVLVDPPTSHHEGPIFLNVLRVVDIPEALGLLAPRPLTIWTDHAAAFAPTTAVYRLTQGALRLQPALE